MSNSSIFSHKSIPEILRSQIEKGLSYYPELKAVPIRFKFKNNIRKSTMQAQPRASSFFKTRRHRRYVILISKQISIEQEGFNIIDLKDKVLIGWFGHELGHIIDYKSRSSVGMLIFGLRYLFSKKHIRKVERTADTIAVQHGMSDYLLRTKNFILNHTGIPPVYKKRMKQLYLSPEEIMEMVNNMDKKTIDEIVDQEMKEKDS